MLLPRFVLGKIGPVGWAAIAFALLGPIAFGSRYRSLPGEARSSVGDGGVIKGRVVWRGASLPHRRPAVTNPDAPMKSYKGCDTSNIEDESLIVDPVTRGVSNVLIWMELDPRIVAKDAEPRADRRPMEVKIENCAFKPHVAVGNTLRRIRFTTLDEIDHYPDDPSPHGHVFKEFTKQKPLQFEIPKSTSPQRITCDIHPWMVGYFMIVDNDCFSVSGKDGRFAIARVPPGTHRLYVWHEKKGFLNSRPGARGQEVQVGQNRVLDLGDFLLDEKELRK